MNVTPDSLWSVKLWEAAVPLLLVVLAVSWSSLMSARARWNREQQRQRRRRRRSERELVRRLRAW